MRLDTPPHDHSIREKKPMEFYDTVIVGAGPSGMMAANELSSTTNLSILVLEKGKEIRERSCKLSSGNKCANCEPCDVVNGVGGAGLFSDGKLCLSNAVGERLKGISGKFTPSVVSCLDDLLRDKGIIKPKPSKAFRRMEKLARPLGFNFECYNVRGMGSENARLVVSELEKKIQENNVVISPNSNVLDLQQLTDKRWVVRFQKGGSNDAVSCRFLLIAVGRSGAKWFMKQTRKLNIETEPRPFYLGIRVETPKEIMNPLTRLSYNPKLSLGRKGETYIKTHCFCEGGFVITYSYNKTRFVGGLSDHQRNTSFSILVEHHTPQNQNTYEYSHYICYLLNQIGNGKVILQTLKDFRKSKASIKRSIELNAVQPTLKDFSLRDISSIFPESVISLIIDFIDRMNTICPGVDNESTLLYAPSLEWCVDRFPVNANMETERKNLYAIGDGSGTTQGIIAAAATGMIAGKDIAIKIQ
ncbi:MAG: NAD(P)/FAD-dependent oxidoreductase [Candidatus Bathyarchaeota archaeon]|nr:NAD(P)/FAD-dependent oxidoreductase [Candidatus Bathyarchaeota archaeon]